MGFGGAQGGSGGGASGDYLPLAGGTMDDGANVALGSTTGTKIGTAMTEKLGFFNATPVVRQPAAVSAFFSGTYATDGNTIVATLNAIRSSLINLGLIAP